MKIFKFSLPDLKPDIALKILGNDPYTFFLDGNDTTHPLSQFSILGFEPVEIFTPQPDNFHSLADSIKKIAPDNKDEFTQTPFTGGLIGYMNYEMGFAVHDMPEPFKQNDTPILFGLYTKTIIFDLKSGTAHLFVISETHEQANIIYHDLLHRINIFDDVHHINSSVSFSATENPDIYKQKIQSVIDYIKNGDIFQANLSHDWTANRPQNFCPVAQYLKMHDINPAPFSAFLNCGSFHILSSSPERFINLKNGILETRPIKGTISDSQPQNTLTTNPKDRAENIMIVDLMRNDFSKICDDHSVTVDALCSLETFKGLHHLVSVVSGRLRAGKTIFDALYDCFPGGSITGAPKIRAMEIIAELESRPRGIYCGSIGYIGFNGNADFNIAIRTVVINDKQIHFSAGGGITAQSNPNDEYDETLVKAQKIIESFL